MVYVIESLYRYLDSAKAFKENEVVKAAKGILLTTRNHPATFFSSLLLSGAAYVYDELDMKKKAEKKEESIKKLKDSLPKENLRTLNIKRDEVVLQNSLYNEPIEIIRDNGELYIGMIRK